MNHIDLKNKTIFVTGSAGFIGSNLVLELLRTQSPINIIGLSSQYTDQQEDQIWLILDSPTS